MNRPDPSARGRRRLLLFWPLLVGLLAAPASPTTAALMAFMIGAFAYRVIRAVVRRATASDRRNRPGRVVLGTERSGRAVVLAERDLSAHGLILGASGTGKSTTMLALMVEQIRIGGPVVAIDLKGSPAFAGRLRDAARAAGRPFALWTLDGPSAWNPLAHGNPTELKDKLIATERFTEPHYQRAAERYLQTALQVLAETAPDRPATLGRVVALLDPKVLSNRVRLLPAPMAERVLDYIAGLTPDQHSAIRGIATRLAIISESHTGRFLDECRHGPAVDLRRALAGDQVVLFSLNSGMYGKLAGQIGTLAVQDLIAASGSRLRAGHRLQATVGIDEFSALGADNVISLLARGRESGISVLLATQELADLDRAASGLRDQVLGNTAVKIAHRQDVPASARTVAELAGTVKQWDRTFNIGYGMLGAPAYSRGTRRIVDRYVVDPNDIKSLSTGEAVLITKLPRARTRTVRVSPPPARAPDQTGGRDR